MHENSTSLATSSAQSIRPVHMLKTLRPYFQAVWTGLKTFEVRRDNRGFQKGDRLVLQEWDYERALPHGRPTGRVIYANIDYILTGGQLGIEPGYVVMAISETDRADDNA